MPYPVATEIIANVVTSPHHLSATMVTGREHRMTEVFARLAPGATLDAARSSCARGTPPSWPNILRFTSLPTTTGSMPEGCTTRSIPGPMRFCGCCSRLPGCCLCCVLQRS